MANLADLMTPDVPRLSTHCTLEDATQAFAQSPLDVLPLCDPDGTLLGVVTQQDISRAFRSLGELANSLRAQHLMNPEAPSISVQDSVEKAMAQMAIHQTQHLPVLDGSTVCGMLSSAQIGQADTRVNIDELIDYVKLPTDPAQAPSS